MPPRPARDWSLPVLLAWFALVGFVGFSAVVTNTSCAAMERRSSIAAPQIDPKVAVGFAAASTCLALADAAETYYLDGLAHPTDAQLDASARRVARLVAAREVLERVRLHLADESSLSDLAQLRLDLATLLAAASASGVKVPPEAARALALLEGYLR